MKTEPSIQQQKIHVKKEPDEDFGGTSRISGVFAGQEITIGNFNSNTLVSRRSPDSTYSDSNTSKGSWLSTADKLGPKDLPWRATLEQKTTKISQI